MNTLNLIKRRLINVKDIDYIIDELEQYNNADDELIDKIKGFFPPEFLDDLIGYLDEYFNNQHVS